MASRSRSRIRGAASAGTYRLIQLSNGSVLSSVAGAAGIRDFETCEDVVTEPPHINPNPLVISRSGTDFPLRISGSSNWILNGYRWTLDGWNPTNRTLYQYAPTISPVNWAYWRTAALANMNPMRPAVDVPLFLFELKDFPAMLRNLGDILSRKRKPQQYTDGYLAYSFGWKPLISDLRKLLQLQKSVDDRIRYFRRLEAGTHLRRRLGDVVISHVITPNGYQIAMPTGGSGMLISSDITYTETQKVWYTANAKLLTSLPESDLKYDEVLRVLLGLNVSASTLWNMVPWSWLIDYFVNIGDFLEATRGHVPLEVSKLCIMCTSVASSSLTSVKLGNGYSLVSNGPMRTIAKQRHVSTIPIPMVTFKPFLTLGQMANLGALVTSKALGSKAIVR